MRQAPAICAGRFPMITNAVIIVTDLFPLYSSSWGLSRIIIRLFLYTFTIHPSIILKIPLAFSEKECIKSVSHCRFPISFGEINKSTWIKNAKSL